MTRKTSLAADSRALTAVSSLAFALLFILVLSTPFVDMSRVLSDNQRAYRLYGYGLVGLLHVALLLMRGWTRTLRIVSTPVCLFVIWGVLSLLWTQNFDLTGKRVALLALVYIGVFAGVSDLRSQRSLSIVRIILVIFLVLNYIITISIPNIGTHVVGGEHLWRGVMAHKNIFGMLCAITVILFVFDSGKLSIATRMIIVSFSILFLYLSWSKTSGISLLVALAAGGGAILIGQRQALFLKNFRKPILISFAGLYGIVLLALVVATIERDFILSLTSDTSSLTGRAAVWRPMIQFYLDHPMLGLGYGAYWDNAPTLSGLHVQNASLWKNVDQGHNGYLDLLVQVGGPGLALALYAAFVWPLGHLLNIAEGNPHRAGLIISLLTFFIVSNFSESILFADDALGNAFLLLALAYTHRFASRASTRPKLGGTDASIIAAQLRESRQERLRNASKT